MKEKAIKKYVSHLLSCPQRYGDKLNPCICGLDQALAELAEQPACKTCGGSKIVLSHDGKPCSKGCQGHVSHPCEECGRQWPVMEVLCPDCKQPEAGEFTKSLRRQTEGLLQKLPEIKTAQMLSEKARQYFTEFIENLSQWLYEACDRIDQQTEQIKQFEADKERLERILNKAEIALLVWSPEDMWFLQIKQQFCDLMDEIHQALKER